MYPPQQVGIFTLMLTLVRRLAALSLGVVLVQLPAVQLNTSCGMPQASGDAHASMPMGDMSSAPECDVCDPPAGEQPCDGSHALGCTANGACAVSPADLAQVPSDVPGAGARLADASIASPRSTPLIPDTPPPRV